MKEGSVLPDPETSTIVLPTELTFMYHCDPSYWTGCPTSPLSLSVTRLNTVKLVPRYAFMNSPLSALVLEEANLNVLLPVTIAK